MLQHTLRVPEQILTPRLLLRAVGEQNARGLHEALELSWEELREVAPWAREMPSLEEERKYCREARQRFLSREDLAYAILDQESGETLGGAGLHRVEWSVPRMEIGYWVRSDRTGKGYAAEAAEALVRVAFVDLGAQRVELRIYAGNAASRRVAEKLGFELEAVLHRYDRDPLGRLQDTCVYVKLAEAPD
jgi:RimJ/RimL family protein N-acetyltransferase